MNKRIRLRNARPKYIFGSQEAAILTAAGITAAATAASAALGASTQRSVARMQADNTRKMTDKQIASINRRNENDNKLQEQAIAFTKDQNEQARQLQKDTQMNIQMLMGNNALNNREMATRIQVKNGKVIGNRRVPQFLLRGGNIPLQVTDGGYLRHLGYTPEGYSVEEARGNDHEHSHKTPNGRKTGVGIKTNTGKQFEVAGNQNKQNGEYIIRTPEEAMIASNENIAGIFNPVKAINAGMNPLEAIRIQETIKDMYGISDDGKHDTKKTNGKRRLRTGGLLVGMPISFADVPDLNTDTSAYDMEQAVLASPQRLSLKNGGKVRPKYVDGFGNVTPIKSFYAPTLNDLKLISPAPVAPATTQNPVGLDGKTNNGMSYSTLNLIGTGISSLGNFLGSLFSNSGISDAAEITSKAQMDAANELSKAYNNLKGIDPKLISADMFKQGNYLPVLSSTFYNRRPQDTLANRSAMRLRNDTTRNTLSGAARRNMFNRIESNYIDQLSKNTQTENEYRNTVRRENAQAANQAAAENARLAIMAGRDLNNARLRVAEYNANVKNEGILGSASSIANGLINASNARGRAATAIASNTGNMFNNIGQNFANYFSGIAKYRNDLENTFLGATTDAKINYIARNGNPSEVKAQLSGVNAALANGGLSAEDKARYEYYKRILESRLNS